MNLKQLALIPFVCMAPFSLFADEPLAVGTEAPALSVTNHQGKEINLGDLYAAGPVLVYFYPKSDTPGCTAQACNLRDNFDALKSAGVEVVGVSIDSVANQQAFREKYDLPFTIVADEDKALGKAFGVGSMLGMAYKRQSFLIVDGKVAWRDLKATPATQTEDALAALAAVRKPE